MRTYSPDFSTEPSCKHAWANATTFSWSLHSSVMTWSMLIVSTSANSAGSPDPDGFSCIPPSPFLLLCSRMYCWYNSAVRLVSSVPINSFSMSWSFLLFTSASWPFTARSLKYSTR